MTNIQPANKFPFGDASSDLANNRLQYIEFYHLPSDLSVQFKAFLTAFSDQYESEWTDDDAFGRMDPVSTFKRTKRTITLGWDVPSASLEEAIENLRRSSLLLSMQYPDFEETSNNNVSTIKTGPLFRLRFMNLIQNASSPGLSAKDGGLLGKMAGLTYEPDLEQGFFDPIEITQIPTLELLLATEDERIAITKKGEGFENRIDGQLFPQTIKFQCQYTVQHDHALGWKNQKARSGAFAKFPYARPIVPREPTVKKVNQNPNDFSERKTGATGLKLLHNR
jgi:hypothetical protein